MQFRDSSTARRSRALHVSPQIKTSTGPACLVCLLSSTIFLRKPLYLRIKSSDEGQAWVSHVRVGACFNARSSAGTREAPRAKNPLLGVQMTNSGAINTHIL
jgi:hypothetical protein